jgi:hypothetical protein
MADPFGYTKNDNEITLDNVLKIKGLEVYFDFITKRGREAN